MTFGQRLEGCEAAAIFGGRAFPTEEQEMNDSKVEVCLVCVRNSKESVGTRGESRGTAQLEETNHVGLSRPLGLVPDAKPSQDLMCLTVLKDHKRLSGGKGRNGEVQKAFEVVLVRDHVAHTATCGEGTKRSDSGYESRDT